MATNHIWPTVPRMLSHPNAVRDTSAPIGATQGSPCPICGSARGTAVIDSRISRGRRIRRRRCVDCGQKCTTVEVDIEIADTLDAIEAASKQAIALHQNILRLVAKSQGVTAMPEDDPETETG